MREKLPRCENFHAYCISFKNNYRLCCVMENTEIWLADTRNKVTFMFAWQNTLHANENLYNTYIFWPLFNVNCSALRPQNVCKLSLPGYTLAFSGYNAVKTVVSISVSNSWIYTYSTRWETGYGETVNSYRWTNPCFLLKTFKASRCSNVRHNSVMSVQPSNVAITPPPEGI